MKSRAERLMENAGDLDAIVIANGGESFLDSTYRYLLEPSGGVFEDCYMVIRKDGTQVAVVNTLEEESARSGKGEVEVFKTREDLENIFSKYLRGCSKVGFNIDCVPYSTVLGIRRLADYSFVVGDARKAISDTVAVKDEREIEAIRKACSITSEVACEIPDYLSEGVSETEVAARMEIRMQELGGKGLAFDTIAAFGPNSSMPHYSPADYRLKKGDAALFDFGCKWGGYCSDLTRTVFFGKPPEELERAYEVVRQAQQAGIDEYRAGAKAKDADLAARKVIDGSEFKGKFIHSFGHGIGMDVHQPIHVSPKSAQVLKAGNIVSAEPGIYIPGVGGIRIEDTVLITENGCERLTSYPHEITIV
ncbi:Xaa-Pro aminopeptidase [Thermoplasmatales archaeon BRNA1]|nr:Xaa-Pro aminopeptidase [Thermoplasmatales archaeon BRNA1]